MRRIEMRAPRWLPGGARDSGNANAAVWGSPNGGRTASAPAVGRRGRVGVTKRGGARFGPNSGDRRALVGALRNAGGNHRRAAQGGRGERGLRATRGQRRQDEHVRMAAMFDVRRMTGKLAMRRRFRMLSGFVARGGSGVDGGGQTRCGRGVAVTHIGRHRFGRHGDHAEQRNECDGSTKQRAPRLRKTHSLTPRGECDARAAAARADFAAVAKSACW